MMKTKSYRHVQHSFQSMLGRRVRALALISGAFALLGIHGFGQDRKRPLPDAVQDAQTPREAEVKRPEQKQTEHDRSDVFLAPNAPPSSTAFRAQPDQGEIKGFDFYRDPLN